MSDLSRNALRHYLRIISRVTRDLFLYIGNGSAVDVINEIINRDYPFAKQAQMSTSGWNDQTGLPKQANELECLYRFGSSRRIDIESKQ